MTNQEKAILQTVAATGCAYDYSDKGGRTPYVQIGKLKGEGFIEVSEGKTHLLTASGFNALGALLAP